MNDTTIKTASAPMITDVLDQALACTPARILVGRAGPAYRTATALKLREDHAAARDAVHSELDLLAAFGDDRIERFSLFWTQTQATSKTEYLRRPDLGRKLDNESRQLISANCPPGADLQVIVGDGLSASAVAAQAPIVLDQLRKLCEQRGWRFGRPFAVRYCRVGVMNDVGELIDPQVLVLLIGERPGLATAESLSAYLAYRPRRGHTDANRNLISNVHARGVLPIEAAHRVTTLAAALLQQRTSGVQVKEEFLEAGSFSTGNQVPRQSIGKKEGASS